MIRFGLEMQLFQLVIKLWKVYLPPSLHTVEGSLLPALPFMLLLPRIMCAEGCGGVGLPQAPHGSWPLTLGSNW